MITATFHFPPDDQTVVINWSPGVRLPVRGDWISYDNGTFPVESVEWNLGSNMPKTVDIWMSGDIAS